MVVGWSLVGCGEVLDNVVIVVGVSAFPIETLVKCGPGTTVDSELLVGIVKVDSI